MKMIAINVHNDAIHDIVMLLVTENDHADPNCFEKHFDIDVKDIAAEVTSKIVPHQKPNSES